MGKKVGSLDLLAGMILWVAGYNQRPGTEYGSDAKSKETRESLAERGWTVDKPVQVFLPRTDQEQLLIEEEYQRRLVVKDAMLKAGGLPWTIFQANFMENGDVLRPKYLGNTGFRRSLQLAAASAMRYTALRNAGLESDGTFLIPAVLMEFNSEADRIICQQLENSLQNVGSVPVSKETELRTSKRLFDMGQGEREIRGLYGNTAAQKYYSVLWLDHEFSDLHIYDDVLRAADDGQRIVLSRVKHVEGRGEETAGVVHLRLRASAAKKIAANKEAELTEPERKKNVREKPFNVAEVRDYFDSCRLSAPKIGNKSPIMERSRIEEMANHAKIAWFKTAFDAVLTGVTTSLDGYVDQAPAINLLKALLDKGNYTVALEALEIASKAPQLTEPIWSLVKSGKANEIVQSLHKLAKKAG